MSRMSSGATLTVADLDVERVGSGPPVVLVHGSTVDARRTWRHQLALAERWTLCVPNRPGFGSTPPLARGDFALEAPLVEAFLRRAEARRRNAGAYSGER
jgi:pimeloyl-ACP methyl ester carboxylesterase